MNNQSKFDKDKFHRQSWSQIAKDPKAWLCYAENLKHAADVLRDNCWPRQRKSDDLIAARNDLFYGPVYMLLSGLAIETLIKGIMVAIDPHLIEQQKQNAKITGHKLVELFRETEITECKNDTDLLSRLQNYVENFGRYPVTILKQNMAKRANTRFCIVDLDKVDRLWKRLLGKIQQYTTEDE
jgi:hypothetical protein